MAFSPDSSQLALALNNFIKILDLNTSACVMTLNNAPYMRHKSMTFSLNGMQLIVSNERWEGGDFRIWDLATETQLQKEDYYQDVREPAVFELDASDEDETLDEDKITAIRSPITGSRVQVFSKNRPVRVVFTLDGMQFAFMIKTKYPRSIYVLDAATGKCLQKFTDYDWVTEHLALSPDGSQLAITYSYKGIHIWDVKTGASLFTFLDYIGVDISPAFSPDGAELASAADFRNIKIWDLTLGSSVDPEKKKWIWSVTYSPDSTRLALITSYYGCFDAFTIEIWDAVEGIQQQQLQVGKATFGSAIISDIAQLAFSPDNTQLACSRRNEIVIRDLTANPQQNSFEFKVSDSIQSIIFSPNGTRLAVTDTPLLDEIGDAKTRKIKTPKIEIWDATNGAIVYTFYSAIEIMNVYFSSDSKRLGSLSREGIVAIWDLNTGACLQTFTPDFEKTFENVDIGAWQEYYLERAQLQCFITNMLQDPGSIPGAVHEFGIGPGISWLLRRGEPFLWLPPKYRSLDITFSGGNIAILLSRETLVLFSLSLAELDAEMASNRSSILDVEAYSGV